MISAFLGRSGAAAPEAALGIALHGAVRALLLDVGFERAHAVLASHLFPLHESAARSGRVPPDARTLGRLTRLLVQLDERECGTASCVSVSLAMQALLFANGADATLVLGLAKRDEHLSGHAWVEWGSLVLNPGEWRLVDFTRFSTRTMRTAVERWAEDPCTSGVRRTA